MTIFIQLFTITYLCVLAIAVGVKARNKYGLSFSAFCFGLVIWIFSNIGFSRNIDTTLGLLFARGAFTSMVIVLMSLQNFAFVFPFQIKAGGFIKRFFMIFHIFVFVASILPWVVHHVEKTDGVLNPVYGSLYPVFSIYILFALVYIFFIFAYKYKKAVSLDRLQLRYFVTGLSLTAAFMLVTNLVLPILTGSSYTSQFGPIGLIFLLSFLSLAILRQRLFDLKLIMGRGIIYFVYGVILFGLFYGLNWFYDTFTGGIYSSLTLSIGVVMAMVVSVFLLQLHYRFESWILGFVLHTNYDLYQISRSFIERVNSKLTMDSLCSEIIEGFNSIFNSTKEGILILEKDDSEVLYKNFVGWDLPQNELKQLLLVLEVWKNDEHGAIILREDLKEELNTNPSALIKELSAFMEELGVAAILPLNRKVALNGVFAIGDKASRDPFTVEDLDLMETLIGYSSVAIGRAMLFEQSKRFNETLKEEVELATASLARANEDLKQLDKAKDDLISIASHELRTPASIVRGKLHLLKGRLEKIKGCEGYDSKIDEDVDVCLSAIEREIEQVNTLLEASRIGRDTMKLEKQDYDLIEVIMQAVGDFQEMAKRKGLSLKMDDVGGKMPKLLLDVKRIREVIDNLITNAIKYTETGEITINIYKGKNDKNVCVSVKDTGLGIPEGEINNLFSKFYRVKRESSVKSKLVKPGGTGLGLYVAKNIVEKHGGTVRVESEEGKGSIFTFCIPKNRMI